MDGTLNVRVDNFVGAVLMTDIVQTPQDREQLLQSTVNFDELKAPRNQAYRSLPLHRMRGQLSPAAVVHQQNAMFAYMPAQKHDTATCRRN